MKRCLDCKKVKQAKLFQKRKVSVDGRSSYCKACISLRTSNYHKTPDGKAAHRKNTYNWKYNHPEIKLIYHARSRASVRNLPCTITIDDIKIPEFCPALGIRLKRNLRSGGPDSPSLDCLIPSLGYVPGNVAVISKRANTIKNDASIDDLRNILKWLEEKIQSVEKGSNSNVIPQ
jgi:hypothetical protein